MRINSTAASLLGFLHSGPMSGAEIVRRVQESIGYFWNVTRSQVYRELQSLEREGLTRAADTGPRDRVRYETTAEGRAVFAQWLREEPEHELTRHAFLLKTFFSAQLPVSRLREMVRAHREGHAARLATYEADWKKDIADEHRRQVLRFGIEYERMVLRWIDELPWLKEPRERKKR